MYDSRGCDTEDEKEKTAKAGESGGDSTARGMAERWAKIASKPLLSLFTLSVSLSSVSITLANAALCWPINTPCDDNACLNISVSAWSIFRGQMIPLWTRFKKEIKSMINEAGDWDPQTLLLPHMPHWKQKQNRGKNSLQKNHNKQNQKNPDPDNINIKQPVSGWPDCETHCKKYIFKRLISIAPTHDDNFHWPAATKLWCFAPLWFTFPSFHHILFNLVVHIVQGCLQKISLAQPVNTNITLKTN